MALPDGTVPVGERANLGRIVEEDEQTQVWEAPQEPAASNRNSSFTTVLQSMSLVMGSLTARLSSIEERMLTSSSGRATPSDASQITGTFGGESPTAAMDERSPAKRAHVTPTKLPKLPVLTNSIGIAAHIHRCELMYVAQGIDHARRIDARITLAESMAPCEHLHREALATVESPTWKEDLIKTWGNLKNVESEFARRIAAIRFDHSNPLLFVSECRGLYSLTGLSMVGNERQFMEKVFDKLPRQVAANVISKCGSEGLSVLSITTPAFLDVLSRTLSEKSDLDLLKPFLHSSRGAPAATDSVMAIASDRPKSLFVPGHVQDAEGVVQHRHGKDGRFFSIITYKDPALYDTAFARWSSQVVGTREWVDRAIYRGNPKV